MELRGSQEKDMVRIPVPTSIGYPSSRLNHHHHHQESSASLLAADTRNNDSIQNPMQTLDPDPATTSAANGSASSSVRYKACLKNHAATMGGHVIDGCGEFMPSGEEGTRGALKCAACDCHRNFHRKEIDGEPHASMAPYFQFNHNPTTAPHSALGVPPQSLHRISSSLTNNSHGPMPSVMMAFGGAMAESSSGDLNNMFSHARGQVLHNNPTSFSGSRKRFRTKFTQKQKDCMHEFAEKIGWKIQKQDEQQVLEFCNEVGVKRQVFKVWMHNNKQNLKKKQNVSQNNGQVT